MAGTSHLKSAVTLIAGACAVLVLATACSGSGGSTENGGSAAGDGTLVLWEAKGNDNPGRVVLVNPADGSTQNTELLSEMDHDLIDLSADGHTMVSASASEGLSVVAIDGANTHESAIPGTQACKKVAVSPSGSRVLCVTERWLRVLTTDGKSVGNDLDLSDESNGRFIDGAKFMGEDQIAYSVEGYSAESSGLYLAPIAGGDAKQFAQGFIGTFDTTSSGLAIAFTVGKSYTAEKIAKYSPSSGKVDTLFTPADGGANTHVWNLQFSPDDSMIAYDFGTLPKEPDGVYVMNADGASPRRIAQSDGEYVLGFAFSPNGTRLAVDVPSDMAPLLRLSTGGIYLFHADGSDNGSPTPLLGEKRCSIVAWVR